MLVDGLGGPVQVDRKNDRTSLVTSVDLAAQDEIVGSSPGTTRSTRSSAKRSRAAPPRADTWLVDPLDGTSNYTHGVPLACTSVAVRDAEGVAAGAIFEPFREELFTGAEAAGRGWPRDRLHVSTTATLDQALVCTGVQSDDEAAVAAFGRRIVELAGRCRAVRCLGSPALCLAYVAAGRIDAFLEADSTYTWDVGAGALMITEAGGRIEASAADRSTSARAGQRAGDERAHPRRAGGAAS